jgi:hypothetical protein
MTTTSAGSHDTTAPWPAARSRLAGRLDVRRKGEIVATVQTATFRVRTGAAAVAEAGAAPAGVAVGDPAGPSLLWPVVGVALLAAGLLARRLTRRRARSPHEPELVARKLTG